MFENWPVKNHHQGEVCVRVEGGDVVCDVVNDVVNDVVKFLNYKKSLKIIFICIYDCNKILV